MTQRPSIDQLLNLVPDSPDVVLTHLRAFPDLAARQDAHGYSLVHAAASYGHAELLTALIQEFKVDANIKDEDGETALFSVEEIDMARLLLDLGTDMSLTNDEGQTAAVKLDDEDEQPAIADFLRRKAADADAAAPQPNGQTSEDGATGSSSHLPPLPGGVKINVGTMREEDVGDAPDPEFRRRIEELAARSDFEGAESQRELRDLITDAVSGLAGEGQGSATRQRLG